MSLIASGRHWEQALVVLDPACSVLRVGAPAATFVDTTLVAPPTDVWLCGECPPDRARCCTTRAGLQSHLARSHGFRHDARFFVASSDCPACGGSYSSRPAAIDHLAYRSKSCAAALRDGRLVRLDAAEAERLNQLDRARAREAKAAGWPYVA